MFNDTDKAVFEDGRTLDYGMNDANVIIDLESLINGIENKDLIALKATTMTTESHDGYVTKTYSVEYLEKEDA